MPGGGKNDAPQFMVVGLGNPGPRYAETRHNAGWWVLDELARRHGGGSGFPRHQSQAAPVSLRGQRVLLIRPQTYMNLSGDSVAAWRRQYPSAGWVLVCDDIALPPGALRLRRQGGHGGHNGIESVIARLHTTAFDRLRIGIGAPGPHDDQADYVLSAPSAKELELLQPAVAKAADVLEQLVAGNFDRASQLASGGDAKQAERRRVREEQARLKAEQGLKAGGPQDDGGSGPV
jgi:PTH1 family peptidyl-tRNA hydrolase